jgi:hypothetical protein
MRAAEIRHSLNTCCGVKSERPINTMALEQSDFREKIHSMVGVLLLDQFNVLDGWSTGLNVPLELT